MAIAEVYTRIVTGISATRVTVEIDISQGLPGFILIGLTESVAKGIKARVRSAIINSGYSFPAKKITLSLLPNDELKEGYGYDLPIALAILIASGQVTSTLSHDYEYYGDLSLDGGLHGSKGGISAILAAHHSNHPIIVASELYSPELVFEKQIIVYAQTLQQACQILQGKKIDSPKTIHRPPEPPVTLYYDLNNIVGQHYPKRALEIAAAGGHSLLMIGAPGTGKTDLANCLPSLLPKLTNEERIAIAQVTNLSSHQITEPICRPFRAPHHSITAAGLMGTMHPPSIGEMTRAHQGILFLDELTLFDRKTLDTLKNPIELESILFTRAKQQITYPAKFQLVAAMNLPITQQLSPLLTHHARIKRDKSIEILSAALIDRFQLSVEVSAPLEGWTASQTESSKTVRDRVILARKIQLRRQGKENARLSTYEVNHYCQISVKDWKWLTRSLKKFSLSSRAMLHIIRVARTIADLKNESEITRTSLQEALSYRYTDRIIHYLSQHYH